MRLDYCLIVGFHVSLGGVSEVINLDWRGLLNLSIPTSERVCIRWIWQFTDSRVWRTYDVRQRKGLDSVVDGHELPCWRWNWILRWNVMGSGTVVHGLEDGMDGLEGS